MFKGLVRPPPERFEAGADVNDPIVPGVPDPEDLAGVLRQLTEAFLGLAPCLLGPLALGGHDAAPDPVQGFAQSADERADQDEDHQGNRVLAAVE